MVTVNINQPGISANRGDTSKAVPSVSSCQKIKTITVEIFKEVIPHLIQVAPIYLNKIINLKILGGVGYIISFSSLIDQLYDVPSRFEQIVITIQILACVAGIATYFYSGGLPFYLAVEALTILSNSIGNIKVFYDSCNKIKDIYYTKNSNNDSTVTALKIAKMASALISLVFASMGSANTFNYSCKLIKGYSVLSTLDSVQRHFVIKHRTLHTLAEKKPFKAVIIDGLSSKWGKITDDVPTSTAQFIYENAETRTYHVSSPTEFYGALKKSYEEMGQIDLLLIEGHANKFGMVLGENYQFFVGSQKEIYGMNTFLKNGAHVHLAGCNTATNFNPDHLSIAEYTSRFVPKAKVTGFSSYLNPFVMTFSQSNMTMKSHLPLGSDEDRTYWTGFSNARMFST